MSELSVGALSGLAANSYVIDVASGSTLDVTNATGTLPSAQLPAGSILQVVSTTKTDTFTASMASGSQVTITGLSATITPTSTASKIYVSAGVTMGGGGPIALILQRDGSPIIVGDATGSRTSVTSGATVESDFERGLTAPIFALDSPSTTSAITYGVNILNARGDTFTHKVNRPDADQDTARYWRSVSTITLMEVAG